MILKTRMRICRLSEYSLKDVTVFQFLFFSRISYAFLPRVFFSHKTRMSHGELKKKNDTGLKCRLNSKDTNNKHYLKQYKLSCATGKQPVLHKAYSIGSGETALPRRLARICATHQYKLQAKGTIRSNNHSIRLTKGLRMCTETLEDRWQLFY